MRTQRQDDNIEQVLIDLAVNRRRLEELEHKERALRSQLLGIRAIPPAPSAGGVYRFPAPSKRLKTAFSIVC
jgi:hypothetical protein